MKRLIIALILTALCLAGCKQPVPDTPDSTPDKIEYSPVTHVGTVPDELKSAIEQNLFYDAYVFEDRLLRCETGTDGFTVIMYDLYGNVIASRFTECEDVDSYIGVPLLTTSDGGFLYAVAVNSYSTGAIEKHGNNALVFKCDKTGAVEWKTVTEDITGFRAYNALGLDGEYYLFNTEKTAESDYNSTDICVLKINSTGRLVINKTISGSGIDEVSYVQAKDGGFVLYGNTQSTDGFFAGFDFDPSQKQWNFKFELDLDLNFVQDSDSQDEYLSSPKGFRLGEHVHMDDEFFESFKDGELRRVIDYGDKYLAVSKNYTGENPDLQVGVSSDVLLAEAVYGMYDNNGVLLWRTSVDLQ